MGIYLPNMEMPTEGEYNMTLYVCSDGSAYMDVASFPVDKDRFEAVPVPPHGRLIDADALRQSLKDSIDGCHNWADEVEGGEMYARVSQALGTFVECSLRVKAAPTIIPASFENLPKSKDSQKIEEVET